MPLFLRSDIALSAPLVDTPKLPPPPFTSDTFDRSNRLGLGMSDPGLGGSSQPWVGATNVFDVVDGRAVLASEGRDGAFFTGFDVPYQDIEASFIVHKRPTAEAVFFDVRRPKTATSPTQDAIRFVLEPARPEILIQYRSVTGGSGSKGSRAAYQEGDRVGIRVKGLQTQLLINDVVVADEYIDIPVLLVGRHVGFAGTALSRNLAIGDMIISPIR